MNERRWKQYFRQAGKYLYCDTSQKDIFEKQIRAAIADLQNENHTRNVLQSLGPLKMRPEAFWILSPKMLSQFVIAKKDVEPGCCGLAALY